MKTAIVTLAAVAALGLAACEKKTETKVESTTTTTQPVGTPAPVVVTPETAASAASDVAPGTEIKTETTVEKK